MNNFFRLRFSAIGIGVLLTLSGCVLQKDLDRLTLELKNTQQELLKAQSQLKNNEQQIQHLRVQLNQKNSEVVTMSVCLDGVGRALSDLGNGDRPGAFLNLSSVAYQCRQADSITEKVRFEQSRTSPTQETKIPLKNMSQYSPE
jgi:septal ring factor EnvC (AmiA/AmiB activator)